MPANLPEVNAIAYPFSGMSMGAVATIYTPWTMVGVHRGEQRTKLPMLTQLQVSLDEKRSIMEQSSPLSLTAQHETLAQGTLLTTVK